MEAKYIEKYDTIADMKAGDVAVSKDRSQLFICIYVSNDNHDDSHLAVIDLNDPYNQYVNKLDTKTKIKKLERGDRFVFTV